MESVNYDIACDVANCKHNHCSTYCTLERIKVGCTCDKEKCTCCESFDEKL